MLSIGWAIWRIWGRERFIWWPDRSKLAARTFPMRAAITARAFSLPPVCLTFCRRCMRMKQREDAKHERGNGIQAQPFAIHAALRLADFRSEERRVGKEC